MRMGIGYAGEKRICGWEADMRIGSGYENAGGKRCGDKARICNLWIGELLNMYMVLLLF